MKKLKSTHVVFLVFSVVLVTFPQIGVVNAEATIYIRSDGSVEGTDKIQQDRNIYSFTDNIYQSLVVEKDNIIIDGAGHTIEGPNTGLTQQPEGIGIMLERRSNVTIINLPVQNFLYGLYVNSSSKNYIINSSITNNSKGIIIKQSSDNTVRESQITNNFDVGIYVFEARDTHIFDNIVANNANDGISLFLSENNAVTYCEIRDNGVGLRIMNSSIEPLVYSCNITSNQVGIHLEASSIHIQFNNIATNEIGIQLNGSDNRIDRNNFINNTKQVYDVAWDKTEMSPSINTWYDGDSGNYWSNYNGAGDTPYIIDENNQDPLPKNIPFRFPNEPYPHWSEEPLMPMAFWLIIITAIPGGLVLFAVFFKKKLKNLKPMLTLLLILSFLLVSLPQIKQVKAQDNTIYIRADGTVEGTNKINRNGNVYILSADLSQGIFIQKSNITLDGAGYTIKGVNHQGKGIDLSNNPGSVTIKNVRIQNFDTGIKIVNTYNNIILGNYIIDCFSGIDIYGNPNDILIKNNAFLKSGISITYSSGNHIITQNNMMQGTSIILWYTPEPTVFMNYWNDYKGTDNNGDGIGDTPYSYISTDYGNFSDSQPLMEPVHAIPEIPLEVMSFNDAINAVSLGNHKNPVLSYRINGSLEQSPFVDERGITGFLVWLASNGTYYQVEYPSEKVLGKIAEAFGSDYNPPDGYTFWWLDYGDGKEYWIDVSDGAIIHYTLPKWDPNSEQDNIFGSGNLLLYVIIPIVVIIVIAIPAVFIIKRKKNKLKIDKK
jgi:parallel beta-helix repeat protein